MESVQDKLKRHDAYSDGYQRGWEDAIKKVQSGMSERLEEVNDYIQMLSEE